MIRFKVVRLRAVRDCFGTPLIIRISAFAQGKYQQDYRAHTTVEAFPGSLGILVFDTYRNASNFLKTWGESDLAIIEVEPAGNEKGRRIKVLSASQRENMLDLFYGGHSEETRRPLDAPKGTIAYKKVKVIT